MVIPLKMVLKSDWKGMHLINTPTKKKTTHYCESFLQSLLM